jgi:hypothetical protein
MVSIMRAGWGWKEIELVGLLWEKCGILVLTVGEEGYVS